jgi:lipid-binding SYLF domain-containing protein
MKTFVKCLSGLGGMALLVASTWAQNTQQSPGQNNAAANTANLEQQAQQTVDTFKQTDPSLGTFFQNSVGYAAFPTITEGAVGIGAAHGKGILYEHGRPTGEVTLSKVTVGAQAGGESFSELIFFETPQALQSFKAGNYAFSAAISAVVAADGAAKTANYSNGVAVFTFARSGLMAKAAIGGQKFTFQPLSANQLGQGTGLPGTTGTGSQSTTTSPPK